MSEMDDEVAPELEVDDADLMEQATPVPTDDEDQYPFGPEGGSFEDDEPEPGEESEEN